MAPKTTSIPPFQESSLASISEDVRVLRATYMTNRTKDIQYRLKQLRKLYWGLIDYTPLLEEALIKDIGKVPHEAALSDIGWAVNECMDFINHLEKWAKDEKVVNTPLTMSVVKPRIRSEPLGVVLVMGAFNFPVQLSITPMIGAIGAGNAVLLKPSENAPNTAMVLTKLIEEYLDTDCYRCVNGSLALTQEILNQKYDKICFTGSKKVGTIIAKKAAETLTPVLLELGGQNPAFISKNANLKLAARRLLWAKTHNAGQVCVSQNYALVDRTVVPQFIEELKKSYKDFMPQGARASPDYARINNKSSFDRLKKMLDSSGGKIVLGGSMDESDLFFEPTVVLVEDPNDILITEETFGPIWSIFPVDSVDQAIDLANKVDRTPLSLYTFGSDAENAKVLTSVTSGGATTNDGYTHSSVGQAPFGGVGSSGTGSYHGYYSFKAFSHQRAIAQVPAWVDAFLRVRYMPYSNSELKRFKGMTTAKPNFDRDGNVTKGLGYWIGFVFGLGGSSAKSAVLRWGLLITLAISLGLKRSSLGL
ncbi:unnamed protein product [Clonostachys solani]|uniref:Aldehyde dehydrogenase n=1 Tax=Clonostachys solani TaxID=160281 RepID=A0A9N9ZD62_9HYPO|nr:unnamed protein product [Clonostachys solani]